MDYDQVDSPKRICKQAIAIDPPMMKKKNSHELPHDLHSLLMGRHVYFIEKGRLLESANLNLEPIQSTPNTN